MNESYRREAHRDPKDHRHANKKIIDNKNDKKYKIARTFISGITKKGQLSVKNTLN